MRVIFQSELLRLTRAELLMLLRKIACELPYLSEESGRASDHADGIRRGPELSAWKGVCSPNNPRTALPGVA